MASGENSGVTSGNQMSFEQQEAEQIAAENERQAQERSEYLRNELPKTSPIPIPDTATIKEEHKKNGYDQVKYEWTSGEYKYLSRWHTHTPGAPEYSQNTWVVERKIPGIGYGVHHREPVEEVMIGHNRWVTKKEWKRAIAARKKGTATKEQKEMLDNGHWKA
jgi:hypothetical protein